MRYLLVTYDETTLPSSTYDLFETVGRFMTEEGINAFLADLHAPSEVEASVAASSGSTPDRGVLESVLAGLDIIDDELSGLPYTGSPAHSENPAPTAPYIEAIWDELATLRSVVRTELDRQDEVAQITEEQWNAFQTPQAREITEQEWDKILAKHPTNIVVVEEK